MQDIIFQRERHGKRGPDYPSPTADPPVGMTRQLMDFTQTFVSTYSSHYNHILPFKHDERPRLFYVPRKKHLNFMLQAEASGIRKIRSEIDDETVTNGSD
jgi:hypothetical protein